MKENIKLVWRKIDELIPYEHNAKLHPQEQIDRLVGSFDEFGRIVPAGIDKDGNLIYGHGRILAARQRGDTDFPCIEIDGLTEVQRRAFVHADNLLAESPTDADVLRREMQALAAAGFDVSITGFDPEGIRIGDEDEAEPQPEAHEDDYDKEPPEEPRTKRGQLWQLGEHRLLCGDATNAEDMRQLVGGEKAALALTDPPYGLGIVSHAGSIDGPSPITFTGSVGPPEFAPTAKPSIYAPVVGDEDTSAARNGVSVMRDFATHMIVFGGNYFSDFLKPSPCWLVWDKKTGSNCFADVELAWTDFGSHARLYSWMWNGMQREGDHSSEGVTRVHPTQKPVGLFGKILADFSEDGDIVLDPFGGSGSTLIACEQLGRRCRMMEIDPHYCDVIIDRWEAFTGKKAVLLDGEA